MNDELLQLRYTKLKRKVSYLKAELEESNSIFMQALTNFQKDFGEYTEPKPVTKKEESRLKPIIEYDIPEKEIDFLFRCIAQKTHPDKLVNKDISKKQFNNKVGLYKKANAAAENRDWSTLNDIASELNIKVVTNDIDRVLYLEETCGKIVEKISEMQKTYAWIWQDSSMENREIIKGQIINALKNRL